MPDLPNPKYQQQEETPNKPSLEKDEAQEPSEAPADSPPQEIEDDLYLSPNELSETVRKKRSTTNNVTAFAVKPKHIYFDSQMDKEEIVLLLRRHPITQLSKIAIITIGLFFPLLLFSSPLLDFLPTRFKTATVLGWYLVLSGFALEAFLTWYFRVFIITNKRVVDIDYYSMVHKDVTTAEIMRIQDMSVVSTGVFASILDLGTLYLQTAGQNFNPARFKETTDQTKSAGIEFEDIAHPIEVKKIISELIATKRRKYARKGFKYQ